MYAPIYLLWELVFVLGLIILRFTLAESFSSCCAPLFLTVNSDGADLANLQAALLIC